MKERRDQSDVDLNLEIVNSYLNRSRKVLHFEGLLQLPFVRFNRTHKPLVIQYPNATNDGSQQVDRSSRLEAHQVGSPATDGVFECEFAQIFDSLRFGRDLN